jgi:hypothetical protein
MEERVASPEGLPPPELSRLRDLDLREPPDDEMPAHVASASGVVRRGDFVLIDFLFVCDQDDPTEPSPLLSVTMPIDVRFDRYHGEASGADRGQGGASVLVAPGDQRPASQAQAIRCSNAVSRRGPSASGSWTVLEIVRVASRPSRLRVPIWLSK